MALDENVGGLMTVVASADLSTKQYLAIKLDSNGQAAVAGAGDACIGILYDKPNAQGVVGAVHPLNGRKAKAVSGAAITKGNLLMSNASGKLVLATTGLYAVGVAVDSASGADEIFQFVAVSLGRVA